MRLADLVATAVGLTEIMVRRARTFEEKAGRAVSCCAGCGACCRQMVPLSAPEAFQLADFIDSLAPHHREAVMTRFDAVVDALDRETLLASLVDTDLLADASKALSMRYFRLGLACPFLVDESCSIHAVRPVACREYNVTTPAFYCRDPEAFGVRLMPMPMPLSLPLAHLTAELTSSPPILVPLTLVPRWAAEHDELRRRTWPGLELFKRFMETIRKTPATLFEGRDSGDDGVPGASDDNG
jgi:Fe-S-cluster containining protein